MQMKMNVLVAAAAALLATGANASNVQQMTLGAGENSSLLFLAMDTTAQTSIVVDLSYNLLDFVPGAAKTAAGTTVVWDFNANSISLNGSAVTTTDTIGWDAAYNTFKNLADPSKVKWAVIAGDSFGNTSVGNYQQYLTTGKPTTANINGQSLNFTNQMGALVNSVFSGVNNKGNCVAAVANTTCAFTAESGADTQYVAKTTLFGNGTWQGKLNWNSLSNNDATTYLNYLSSQQPTPGKPTIIQLDNGQGELTTLHFDIASNKLTYTVAAAVPEPSTYAMAIAGLALVGALARRRNKA